MLQPFEKKIAQKFVPPLYFFLPALVRTGQVQNMFKRLYLGVNVLIDLTSLGMKPT